MGTSHLPSERIAGTRQLATTGGAIPYVEEMLRWLPANGHLDHPGAGAYPLRSPARPLLSRRPRHRC